MAGPPALPDPFEAFRDRAARDRNTLDRLMAGLGEPHETRLTQRLDALESLAHGLAGAGGTFGFPELSKAAARVERRLEGWRRLAPAGLSTGQLGGLRTLVAAMRAELDGAAAPQAPMPPR